VTIRPMERADLDAVAALYERVMRPGGAAPSPELRAWFERVVFDHPSADPEIPSLVAVEAGGLAGFLASHPRRLQLDGATARLACSGQLVVDPEARRRATGALLLRTYLDGPQDLTITDGATELVRAMWERLGGEPAHLQCIEWLRALRPGSLAATLWARRRGRPRPAGPAAAVGRAADAAARLLPAPRAWGEVGGPDRPQRRPAGTEQLTAEMLVAELPRVASRMRLRPDYDAPFARWLLQELDDVHERGNLRARLVRDADRGALGWFAYYLVPGGLSPAVSVAAGDEASAGAVLDALLDDATEGGAAAVHGRLEPLLVAPTAARGCFLRYTGQALVHARDPAVAALAASRHALLTRLEGEWWMGPHLL
jgi:GNAT superfamily N-acetyltransferase